MVRIVKVSLVNSVKHRECSKCGEAKPFTAFYKKTNGAYGISSRCKVCVKPELRADKYKSRYGITVSRYDRMFKDCNGVCEICGKDQKENLVVDHCHDTGKIRGLLCKKCNLLISHSHDNADHLLSAARYLNGNI